MSEIIKNSDGTVSTVPVVGTVKNPDGSVRTDGNVRNPDGTISTRKAFNEPVSYGGNVKEANSPPDYSPEHGATYRAAPGTANVATYSVAHNYRLNEAVSFNGNNYISIMDSNIGHQPDTQSGFWKLYTIAGVSPVKGKNVRTVADLTKPTGKAQWPPKTDKYGY